jgi:short-chain fatty acids transporter
LILPIAWIIQYIHWGIGMMTCIALLRNTLFAAKEKGYPIHAPALVAGAYGTVVAAVGISQAGPLYGATPGFLRSLVSSDAALNYVKDSYILSESVLAGWNLAQCAVLFMMVVVVGYAIMPKNKHKMVGCSDELYEEVKRTQTMFEANPDRSTFAQWINNSRILPMVIGVFGLIWCIELYATKGFGGLTINNFNFTMLILGFILCGTPERFSQAAIASVGAVWGVIIQFPLYAGIFGMISYTGLSDVISNAFMVISTTKTFPFVAYIYSAVLNMAVPSGGSKFVIEAPYLLDVAARLNVSVSKLLVAYTYGDMTTNIIQPFWALPYLTMCHIDFKKMLPYTMVICLGALVVCSFFFLVIY